CLNYHTHFVISAFLSSCPSHSIFSSFFFFNDPATTEIYTLSLHYALPISRPRLRLSRLPRPIPSRAILARFWARVARTSLESLRSEEHTSELQSRFDLVCRLLLEKKKEKREERKATQKKNTCREERDTRL